MNRFTASFLADDHKISLDESVSIINAEITWCYNHAMEGLILSDFRDGFIAGLKQSKRLIIELARAEHE